MDREKRYYVYMLSSRARVLYTGITNNIRRRVAEHREGKIPGFTGKYRISGKYRIYRLVYFEVYLDARSAISREKQIKRWRREKKVALIEIQNSTWDDLAAECCATQEKAGPSALASPPVGMTPV
jgi:putative endonuclease